MESNDGESENWHEGVECVPEREILSSAVNNARKNPDNGSTDGIEQVNIEGKYIERRIGERGVIRQREENPPAEEVAE